jgi:hypothetical protein
MWRRLIFNIEQAAFSARQGDGSIHQRLPMSI